MAKAIDNFFHLTYSENRNSCVNVCCLGHSSPLKVNVDINNCYYYVMDRLRLNEFWNCCLEDKKNFCSERCVNFYCAVCKWVRFVYNELEQNFFFDFDTTRNEQPYLWKVYSSFLDKKSQPFLIKIEILRRI